MGLKVPELREIFTMLLIVGMSTEEQAKWVSGPNQTVCRDSRTGSYRFQIPMPA